METSSQSNEIHLQKNSQLPSFCPPFKSSFARSLSFNANNQTKTPSDFDINLRIAQNVNHLENVIGTSTSLQAHRVDEIDEDFEEFMRNSPLKKSMQNASNQTMPPMPSPRNIKQLQEVQANQSSLNEIKLLRLRKECHILLEENHRLGNGIGSHENIHQQDVLLSNRNNSVEETVFQTQIETLQWQLSQVESSRQMYHALMEEVVRFLERCCQNLESIKQQNKITRSRSINHMLIEQPIKSERRVSDIGSLHDNFTTSSYQTGANVSIEKDQLNDSFVSSISATTNSAESYNNFTDFTWRRSPKKSPQKSLNDDDTEKLSQEAFRLYRTAQNLLNLKEPILSESKTLQSYHQNSMVDMKSSTTLQRKLKSRESHLSCQSSSTSDGSVHSSSSNRTEIDEENPLIRNGLPVLNGNVRRIENNTNEMEVLSLGKDRIKSVASSSADDESGFSSMNSFHHETNSTSMLPPLPLNSTMLSNQLSLSDEKANDLEPIRNEHRDLNAFNIIQPILPIIHKRFDSAPPIPPKKKLTTFNSLKNEQSPDKTTGIHVLWV